jgi:hypothetical protein
VCQEIVKSGSKYSDDIGWLYEQTKEYLDPNYVWKNGDSEFSNYMIDLKVTRDIPINIGSKSTGRYGDKGVVSEIVDDDKMPFTEDGRVVDVELGIRELLAPEVYHDTTGLVYHGTLSLGNVHLYDLRESELLCGSGVISVGGSVV